MLRHATRQTPRSAPAIVTGRPRMEQTCYYVGVLLRDRRPVFFSRHKGVCRMSTKPVRRYGRRKFNKMYALINDLRKAIPRSRRRKPNDLGISASHSSTWYLKGRRLAPSPFSHTCCGQSNTGSPRLVLRVEAAALLALLPFGMIMVKGRSRT